MSQNIDVHSHILPSELLGDFNAEVSETAQLYNVKIGKRNIGPVPKGFFDLSARREELKNLSIISQVVSVTHHLFMYGEDKKLAQQFSRKQNEAISSVCKSSGGTFVGNGTVPMQDTQLALEELEFIHQSPGLKGIEIGTNIAGKNLDSTDFYPLYEKLQDYDMPVFIHPNDVLGGDRMKKYYMEIVVGTLAETTVAGTCLIFGGILKRFPKLKFILCHGGGALPYQIGRLERAVSVRKELQDSQISAREDFHKLHFDTVVFGVSPLKWLVDTAGDKMVLFGTDYPFNMGEWDSLERISEMTASEETKRNLAYDNTRRLYGL